MSAARHMIALLKSHLEGDDKEFLSVAMQAAAHEARLGHITIAQQLRDLIDESKRRSSAVLGGSTRITSEALIAAVHERKAAAH